MSLRSKLEDVAKMAGVSTATVSRCLNEPGKVTNKTRERVMNAVDALGYTPHFGAKALASRKTRTVGAVIPTMDNAIFARGLQAFQEALAAAGVTLLVSSSGYDAEQEADQIRVLVMRGAEGVLLIGTARLAKAYEFLARSKTPYVIAWALSDRESPCVGFDNMGAAKAMAERVLALGHRDIAMISGITAMNDRAASRVEGVRAALVQAGLDPDRLSVEEVHYAFDAAGKAFERLMVREVPPTAIICGNDVLGVGAISAAKRRGLRVPEDISITGFDDIDIAAHVEPGLTTVHVPHERMGAGAAAALLALIEGDTPQATVCIETRIVERGSLGPPRGGA
ncbi:MAG: LacI family DNA-binding transcriptional regulator [Fulvimarina manganoxydans]|uniref:LacI family DNA-binding transcriptional regulator n=1 Tax=Fulvimarina manganoxydans TaxID=937218 RepID=UPI0023552BD6|nr:LacI family DNA-binding transcriptional regulator [Fulvimarina manganoxydans]MCK5933970.1 LacI family DNA-binding transcriptional regulator [Fulvimarina manganoxydans]